VCIERFPTCDRALKEALPCMDRAQRNDIWLALKDNAHCRPLRECIFGFEANAVVL
jgi:hypothetical protein